MFDRHVNARALRALAPAGQQSPVAAPLGVQAWYVVGLLSLVNIFNYMDRTALSILLPDIQAELRISDSEAGLLVGLAFALFYAICGVPLGYLADRGSRRTMISWALAIWSAMTAACGIAQNFWHLLLCRIGVGAGEAGSLPPSQSILCDHVPLERRPGIFALYNFAAIVGMTTGMAGAGYLGEAVGWRWTFLILGLPGLLVAVLVRLTLSEPERGRLDPSGSRETTVGYRKALSFLAACRTYRLLVTYLTANAVMQFGSSQWLPTFYTRIYDLEPSSVGAWLGLTIGIGSGLGILVGGHLSDRAMRRAIDKPLSMGSIAVLLAIPAAISALFVGSVEGSLICLGIAGFLWTIPTAAIVALNLSVVPPHIRATSVSISILLISGVGMSSGPLLVGVASDVLVSSLGHQSIRYALVLPFMLLPFMSIILMRANDALPSDLSIARTVG